MKRHWNRLLVDQNLNKWMLTCIMGQDSPSPKAYHLYYVLNFQNSSFGLSTSMFRATMPSNNAPFQNHVYLIAKVDPWWGDALSSFTLRKRFSMIITCQSRTGCMIECGALKCVVGGLSNGWAINGIDFTLQHCTTKNLNLNDETKHRVLLKRLANS